MTVPGAAAAGTGALGAVVGVIVVEVVLVVAVVVVVVAVVVVDGAGEEIDAGAASGRPSPRRCSTARSRPSGTRRTAGDRRRRRRLRRGRTVRSTGRAATSAPPSRGTRARR